MKLSNSILPVSFFILIIPFVYLTSCINTPESGLIKTKHGWKKYVVDKNGDSTLIVYNEKKQKTSQVQFKNNLYNGIGYNFYLNGKVKNEIHYKNGYKEGVAKWYYEDGTLYRSTTYKKNKKDGVQKRYYRNGQLETEVIYKNNEPQEFKEYKKDGTLITDYPEIKFKEIDKLAFERKYYIDVYLEPKGKNTKLYRIVKLDGSEFEIPLPKGPEESVGRITYFVAPGDILMKKLRIKAVTTTKHGNRLVLYKDYNVAVENRFSN